jgi:hypothetical protein
MSEIAWIDGLATARKQAADEGRLLLTYIFAPG